MKQIRPIKEEEAPEFLRLLCTVFELDPARAGTIFYSEPFFDLRRKWALFIDGKIATILTTTPLEFGDGKAIGIAGVGTAEAHRGKGQAQELLEVVLGEAAKANEPRAILFAHQETLYRRCGFETLDHVIRGRIDAPCSLPLDAPLSIAEVQERYRVWSQADPRRLRRDERRWRYWHFVYRDCFSVSGGYVASEASLCREAIFDSPLPTWPLLSGAEWYGLRSMTEMLNVPLQDAEDQLILMGRGFDAVPQMFMSDQF